MIAPKVVRVSMLEWALEAERILQREWFLSFEGAGFDAERVAGYYAMELEPAEWVAWFAEKYDLFDFADVTVFVFEVSP